MTVEEFVEDMRQQLHGSPKPVLIEAWFMAQQARAEALGLDWADVCALAVTPRQVQPSSEDN